MRVSEHNCAIWPLPLAITGTVFGALALLCCAIQVVIMAKFFQKLSMLMKSQRRFTFGKTTKKEHDEEDQVSVISLQKDVASPTVNIPTFPGDYSLSQRSSFEPTSSSSDDTPAIDPDLPSPSVAALRETLALPLKIAFQKSHTLDWHMSSPEREQPTAMNDLDKRPRAQTGSMLNRGKQRTQSEASTPGSRGSPCRDPLAYVVTEIVDVGDTNRRPSVRLRGSRPRKQLTEALQRQLSQPDPFYFSLEVKAESNSPSTPDSIPTPSPTKIKNCAKGWRQVLPLAASKGGVDSSPCDENRNLFTEAKERHSSESSGRYPRGEGQPKVALKPPSSKARSMLSKTSSAGYPSREAWSPRTMARHRMLLQEAACNNSLGRKRTGSMRARCPTPPELATKPDTLTFAEEGDCYSKLIRGARGRRRASSAGNIDDISTRGDVAYNQLVLGL
ncbi:uncharacterized protein [Diadema antillarum]|uniref:uncharacterized protein n=1 Tax=Diadema antillarum TaxID=105358 RepID=UPI003A8392F7